MFAFCMVERDSGRVLLARDRLGIKPLYLAEVDGALRFASTLPALLARRRRHERRPGGAAPLPDLHSVVPAPRTILRACSCRRPRRWRQPDGRRRDDLLAGRVHLPPRRRLVARAGDAILGALRGGRPAHGGRRAWAACSRRARPAWSSGCCPGRRVRPRTFSIGFGPAARGRQFHTPTSSPSGSAPATTASASTATGCCRRSRGDRRHGEPMVSHDVVAFSSSQEVSQHVKVVQSGQGRRGLRRLPLVPADARPGGRC